MNGRKAANLSQPHVPPNTRQTRGTPHPKRGSGDLGWGCSALPHLTKVRPASVEAFASNGHLPSRLSLAGYSCGVQPRAEIPKRCVALCCRASGNAHEGPELWLVWSPPGSSGAGAFLSMLLRRGDLSRLNNIEKFVPQTLISPIKLCCRIPPFPACRRRAALARSDKDGNADVVQSLPCQSGDCRLSGSGLISFPLPHRQLNWEWRLPITPISSLIW